MKPQAKVFSWLAVSAFATILGGGVYQLSLSLSHEKPTQKRCSIDNFSGEMELLPPVELTVIVDKDASAWLTQNEEQIAGSIWFDGYGETSPDCTSAPGRPVALGQTYFEMLKPGTIQLDNLSISLDQKALLKDDNFHYTMNVYSARKNYPNNGLSCTVPIGRSSDILRRNHVIRVNCKRL